MEKSFNKCQTFIIMLICRFKTLTYPKGNSVTEIACTHNSFLKLINLLLNFFKLINCQNRFLFFSFEIGSYGTMQSRPTSNSQRSPYITTPSLNSIRFTAKLNRRDGTINFHSHPDAHIPYTQHIHPKKTKAYKHSFAINILYQCGTPITVDEPTPIHCYYLSSQFVSAGMIDSVD